MLKAAVESVVAAEPDITHFDTVAGDGDAGLTLKVGGEAILEKLSVDAISSQDVVAAVVTISAVISKEMGGTAGKFYPSFDTVEKIEINRLTWRSVFLDSFQGDYTLYSQVLLLDL